MSKAGLGETVGRGKRGKLVEDPKFLTRLNCKIP